MDADSRRELKENTLVLLAFCTAWAAVILGIVAFWH